MEKEKEWDFLRRSTPARIGVGRTGTRPLTQTLLQFRADHAAAVDAVYGEVSLSLLEKHGLFTIETEYKTKSNYLNRPDDGRRFSAEALAHLSSVCVKKPQVQVVVSDGLSASAVEENLSDIYPALMDSLTVYGLTVGTPFFVKGGRVGCMDPIGDCLEPEVLVLLIGERPGLVTPSSLSAYMCYRPRAGRKDAERTVISNIHRKGTPAIEAGAYIGTLAMKMIEQQVSGVGLVL
ncbi:ethanolamine ammonia-lyase subunit EutC [Ammoniphilus sp. 3BR4]|uniref:ethanolamine ammonia-lyase subunit EutC n=1 Tax=Ammoniphilus sp. 3BR4 TaxID=3158265 RepID=UPI003465DF81